MLASCLATSPLMGMLVRAICPMVIVSAAMVESSPAGTVIAGVWSVLSVGWAVTWLVTVPPMDTPSLPLLMVTDWMKPDGSRATMSRLW